MKKILFFFLFIPLFSISQITYVGISPQPTDNTSQAGPNVIISVLGTEVAGDLLVIVVGYKASAAGIAVTMNNSSNQTWNNLIEAGGATSGLTLQVFWARYNGTFSGLPSVTITSGTLAMSAHMYVFRPTVGSNTWMVSEAAQGNDMAASTSMSSPVINGFSQSGDLSLAAVITNDDNTISNSGYFIAGSNQYRNTQGTDISMQLNYKFLGNQQTQSLWTQATLGADTYASMIVNFREVASSTNTGRFFNLFNNP